MLASSSPITGSTLEPRPIIEDSAWPARVRTVCAGKENKPRPRRQGMLSEGVGEGGSGSANECCYKKVTVIVS